MDLITRVWSCDSGKHCKKDVLESQNQISAERVVLTELRPRLCDNTGTVPLGQ